jgi:uncharacterized membrane protein YkoI
MRARTRLSGAATFLLLLALSSQGLADTRKIQLAHAPSEVRQTITNVLKSAKLKELRRRTEHGETTFEATMTRNNLTREFVVATDGELLSMEIGLDEVPAAARGTIQRVAGKATIERIDRTVENGEPLYEVSMEHEGKSREFTVSVDGVMTRYEVDYAQLPLVVRRTVQANIATNQIERVDRTFEDGELNYDVQFTTNGEARVLVVGTNGTLSRIEIGLNQAPAEVQKAIRTHLRGWKPGDIDKVFDEGEVTYEVQAKKGRATREFVLDSGGKLVSEQIALTDAPVAVRRTIESKLGAGKLTRLDRYVEADGTIVFDVESKANGRSFDFSVGLDGTFLGEN